MLQEGPTGGINPPPPVVEVLEGTVMPRESDKEMELWGPDEVLRVIAAIKDLGAAPISQVPQVPSSVLRHDRIRKRDNDRKIFHERLLRIGLVVIAVGISGAIALVLISKDKAELALTVVMSGISGVFGYLAAGMRPLQDEGKAQTQAGRTNA